MQGPPGHGNNFHQGHGEEDNNNGYYRSSQQWPSVIGSRLKVGAFFATVQRYDSAAEQFEIKFEVGGQRLNISRSALSSLLKSSNDGEDVGTGQSSTSNSRQDVQQQQQQQRSSYMQGSGFSSQNDGHFSAPSSSQHFYSQSQLSSGGDQYFQSNSSQQQYRRTQVPHRDSHEIGHNQHHDEAREQVPQQQEHLHSHSHHQQQRRQQTSSYPLHNMLERYQRERLTEKEEEIRQLREILDDHDAENEFVALTNPFASKRPSASSLIMPQQAGRAGHQHQRQPRSHYHQHSQPSLTRQTASLPITSSNRISASSVRSGSSSRYDVFEGTEDLESSHDLYNPRSLGGNYVENHGESQVKRERGLNLPTSIKFRNAGSISPASGGGFRGLTSPTSSSFGTPSPSGPPAFIPFSHTPLPVLGTSSRVTPIEVGSKELPATNMSNMHHTDRPLSKVKASQKKGARVSSQARTSDLSSNTKTQVFKQMHGCYKRGRIVQNVSISSSTIEVGLSTSTSSRSSIPAYEELEKCLENATNINAARICTLRSRQLMRRTMIDLIPFLPASPDMYVVNCITSACPMCGRYIALNKLASYENWCKHLDLHGDMGKRLSARFRAVDKNASCPPDAKSEMFKDVLWADVKPRADIAPYEDNLVTLSSHTVPFSCALSWEAIMLSQLFHEKALLSSSVVVQELLSLSYQALGLQFEPNIALPQLVEFQKLLDKACSKAFDMYQGQTDFVNGAYERHHLSVLQNTQDTSEPQAVLSLETHQMTGEPRPLSYPEQPASASHPDDPQEEQSALQNVSDKLIRPQSGISARDKDFALLQGLYCDESGSHMNLDESRAPSYEGFEGTFGSLQSRNIARIFTARQRQLLAQAMSGFPGTTPGHSSDDATSLGDSATGEYVVNCILSICPFCTTPIFAKTLSQDNDALLDHVETDHAECGATLVARYRAAALDEALPAWKSEMDDSWAEVMGPLPNKRSDQAPNSQTKAETGLLLLNKRFDWRAAVLDLMLRNSVLKPTSVLTQEIVVLGLFYFGLVNQRSPQKFGQYPQLQDFQRALHAQSNQAYDIYCGVGIKDMFSLMHTRGKPVTVTTSVLRNYTHYGLSHKSLKRNRDNK